MPIAIIEEVLQLIEKFGLSLVILIVLLFWLKPKLDLVWSVYSEQRGEKELSDKQKAMLNVDNILKFDLRVKALLTELRDDIHCDWAQLWQFHDGIYSMGLPHIPFLYVSITHEVTSGDVMPMSMVYRSLPTTFFREAGDKFETEDTVITTLTDTADQVSKTFAIGALSNCLLPIRNSDGHLAAILSVGYQQTHTFTDADCNSMKQIARRLGIYLATAIFGSNDPLEGLDQSNAKV